MMYFTVLMMLDVRWHPHSVTHVKQRLVGETARLMQCDFPHTFILQSINIDFTSIIMYWYRVYTFFTKYIVFLIS